MNERPIRVVVVDDSAFARKVLTEVLARTPGIEVVGIARDGIDALEKIGELRPDVVTLDLVMPALDGLGVLRALPGSGGPRVVVVSMTDADSELAIEALHSGAVDLVRKPTALATDRLYELSEELVAKIRAAAGARAPLHTPSAPVVRTNGWAAGAATLVVVGASTGGPQAITRLVGELPADLPVPVVIALHIPAGYTEALARRIDSLSALTVVEAYEEIELRPGLVVLCRGGSHIRVARDGARSYAHAEERALPGLHVPSVNALFESAASDFGAGVIGVVLTGMGDDGLRGAREIVAAGGSVLTEEESSCVVYGMPRCVDEAGLSAARVGIEGMAKEIVRRL